MRKITVGGLLLGEMIKKKQLSGNMAKQETSVEKREGESGEEIEERRHNSWMCQMTGIQNV